MYDRASNSCEPISDEQFARLLRLLFAEDEALAVRA